MDKNTRWVVLGYVGISLIIAWTLIQGLITGFHYLGKRINVYDLNRELLGLGENFTLAHLIGIVITLIIGWICWRHENLNRSAHEVVEELRKVTWPTGAETQTATIVVIVATAAITLVLWMYDIFWGWATGLIL
ncbi:MAG: preprotein translocase subunit SecE [Deltaproteobacteria bacterium]|nr:MAG: preprotein translocase subunit SecE [Deltaproteobacteria bacterium]